jgi:ribosomal protein S18 acetylase RimI-like enzyme
MEDHGSLSIITAQELERSALRDLFNAGFSGYLVPMHQDEATFRTHLIRNDIDLTVSPVLLDGDPVAFALVGIRETDAWVGGTGTVPEARRRGHARRTMQAAVASARDRGCRSLWLEVIDANTAALGLYEQLGFETTRDLLTWRLPRSPNPGESVAVAATAVDPERASSWIAANRVSAEPWQRADRVITTLERDGVELRAIGVEKDGELAGAAIYTVTDESARVLQITAADEAIATTLLSSAARTGPLSLGNVPVDESPSQAMASLGGELIARQHEMRLAL